MMVRSVAASVSLDYLIATESGTDANIMKRVVDEAPPWPVFACAPAQ
jgi:hypothetical protein